MMSRKMLILAALVIIGLSLTVVLQRQFQARLRNENEGLRLQGQVLQSENERLSHETTRESASHSATESPSAELLRLRGEVGGLRREADQLKTSLAQTQRKPQQGNGLTDQQSTGAQEYPTTPEAATTGIFGTLVQGDLQKFVTDFGEPGVPKEIYEKLFNTDRVKGYFAQIDSVSVGQATNSFGPNTWFVPYKLHFKDGTEKEMQLHVGQEPRSQRWYLKGGI